MALLLCLTTLTLLVGSSTAWAAESELSDIYVLMDDVDITPLSLNETGLQFFYSDELDIIRGYIKKLPKDYHYFVCLDNTSTSELHQWLILYGPEMSFVDGWSSTDWKIDYDVNTFYGFFEFNYNLSNSSRFNGFFNRSDSWKMMSSGSVGYNVEYSGFVCNTPGSFRILKGPFYSDLGSFPDLIEDREEVSLLYATVFGLAVFLVFGRFVALWRSIRGRDT